MKKVITTALLAAMLMLPSGAMADITAEYNSSENCIFLKGSFPEQVYSVSVHVARVNETNTVSEDNPPLISDLIIPGEDGTVSYTLKNNLPNGIYNVFAGYSAKPASYQRVVIFNPDSVQTRSMLEKVNKAANEADIKAIAADAEGLVNLGIDASSEAYLEDALAVCIALRPDSGYDIAGFSAFFAYADAVCEILDTNDADSVMKRAANVFDSDYAGYLDAKKESDVDSFMQKGGIAKEKMSLLDISLLSELSEAESRGDVESIVMKNAETLGVDVSEKSDFKDIAKNKRYILWDYIKSNKSDITTKSGLKSLFDKGVEKALDFEDSPSSGGGGGSGSGGKASSVAPSVITTPVASSDGGAVFSDIAGHFAAENIGYLHSLNIINGYPDSTFLPDGSITRAELCKIICTAFGFEQSFGNALFDDVSFGSWYFGYVSALASEGIVTGYNGRFNPDDNITRQDSAVIIMRALESKGIRLDGSYEFSDDESISIYARKAVGSLASAGYLKGDGVSFYPLNSITRGETAELVGRIHKAYGGEQH